MCVCEMERQRERDKQTDIQTDRQADRDTESDGELIRRRSVFKLKINRRFNNSK